MTPKQINVLFSAHTSLYSAIEIIEKIKTTPETAELLSNVLDLLEITDNLLTKVSDI